MPSIQGKMENITEKKEEQKYVPCVPPVIYQYQREVKQKYVHQSMPQYAIPAEERREYSDTS